MTNQRALTLIQKHIQDYYAEYLNPNRLYHNLQHTQEIVKWSSDIANHYNLDPKGRFITDAAAWFSYVCFDKDPERYQKLNARLAEKFLRQIQLTDDLVKGITDCILSSRIPQRPKNTLEQITCDAHLYHLGLDDYEKRSRLMRKERELITGKKVSKDEWKQRDLELLQNHRFKTEYARELLQGQQKSNFELLYKKDLPPSEPPVELTNQKSLPENSAGPLAIVPLKEASAKGHAENEALLNKIKSRPERGIETMFKISSNNHQALSQMADSKAHIMITVNSIIISVLLSVVFRSLDNEPQLAIPVALLLLVNVVTIIFSILATRPNIPSASSEKLKKEDVNLLFFGNYYKMNLADFSEGMVRLMEDRDFLYGSLIKNLHSQGLVLSKKYRLLRISYNIFMYGLVISIMAFGLAVILKGL
jgi:predicted metal-dependent HD superfamily phosphohydrolase